MALNYWIFVISAIIAVVIDRANMATVKTFEDVHECIENVSTKCHEACKERLPAGVVAEAFGACSVDEYLDEQAVEAKCYKRLGVDISPSSPCIDLSNPVIERRRRRRKRDAATSLATAEDYENCISQCRHGKEAEIIACSSQGCATPSREENMDCQFNQDELSELDVVYRDFRTCMQIALTPIAAAAGNETRTSGATNNNTNA